MTTQAVAWLLVAGAAAIAVTVKLVRTRHRPSTQTSLDALGAASRDAARRDSSNEPWSSEAVSGPTDPEDTRGENERRET